MPFRTDAEIMQMADEAMGEVGGPRCLFATGAINLVGMTDMEASTAPNGFFPFDSSAYQQAMGAAFDSGKTSSCGLTTEAAWRYAGVDAPILYESYAGRVARGKFVVMMEKVIAEEQDAWVSGIPWVEGSPLPWIGDAPIIGCTSCGAAWARGVANLEHIYNLIAYDPAGNGIHHSVDGGQPGVKLRTRALVEVWTGEDAQGRRTGELWAAAVDDQGNVSLAADGRPAIGRRFIGYANVARLQRGAPEGDCRGTSPLARRASQAGKVLLVGAAATAAFFGARWARGRR
jgi:hypothetical protein